MARVLLLISLVVLFVVLYEVSTLHAAQQTSAPPDNAHTSQGSDTSVGYAGSTGSAAPMISTPYMPSVAQQSVAVVHGDLRNPPDGKCWVRVFSNGQPRGLGSGMYRVEYVSGSPDEIQAKIARVQAGSAQDAGMPCPIIP